MYIIDLRSAHGRARISLKGAQVLDAQFSGGPLLWLSPSAPAQIGQQGQAIRGGVPVCFPWFGRREGLPAHGFARLRDWRLTGRTDDRAVFALDDDEDTRSLWPHRFHAELAVRIDDGLSFEFNVTNVDDVAFTFTYALHSYFAVSVPFRVVGLDADATPIDAVFEHAPDHLNLHGANNHVAIESHNMASAVVWNPGPNDVGDIGGHWRDFVCVERGNIGDAAITLESGDRHASSMRLVLGRSA